jgi:hypothetical protein
LDETGQNQKRSGLLKKPERFFDFTHIADLNQPIVLCGDDVCRIAESPNRLVIFTRIFRG